MASEHEEWQKVEVGESGNKKWHPTIKSGKWWRLERVTTRSGP